MPDVGDGHSPLRGVCERLASESRATLRAAVLPLSLMLSWTNLFCCATSRKSNEFVFCDFNPVKVEGKTFSDKVWLLRTLCVQACGGVGSHQAIKLKKMG